MLKLIAYLAKQGISTIETVPDKLDDACSSLPTVTSESCPPECRNCVDVCPTDAITINSEVGVVLDRGSCIGCNLCVTNCPSGTIVEDRSTETWAYSRNDLLISKNSKRVTRNDSKGNAAGTFQNSLAVRVVSTGCAACDLEFSAASNPIFDMDRFGIHVVASPRFADALVITGPVPLAMHEPLLRCYKAMAEPKIVIALGTCATSGGVHSHGYAEANGAAEVLPVDIFIPGCPPHPWQIINGMLAAKSLKK